MKNIFILGGTGTIGRNALNVISQNPDKLKFVGFSFHENIEEANRILNKFNPSYVYSTNLPSNPFPSSVILIDSIDGLEDIFISDNIDIIICGISGFAGLETTMTATKSGKRILVANKESIVAAGQILLDQCNQYSSTLVPLDSEHNAIVQCLPDNADISDVSHITITASGGPFIGYTLDELKKVSYEDAIRHPNWSMGVKISIDSATLVNKCLELIEASYLFKIPENQIDVLVHPQSIVHSMVTYIDGSTIAHMSNPSMEIPIANAISDNRRLDIQFDKLFQSETILEFTKIPSYTNSIFNMAREAARSNDSLSTIFNATNEVAVESFVRGLIPFDKIYPVIEGTLDKVNRSKITDIESIYNTDKEARISAMEMIKSIS